MNRQSYHSYNSFNADEEENKGLLSQENNDDGYDIEFEHPPSFPNARRMITLVSSVVVVTVLILLVSFHGHTSRVNNHHMTKINNEKLPRPTQPPTKQTVVNLNIPKPTVAPTIIPRQSKAPTNTPMPSTATDKATNVPVTHPFGPPLGPLNITIPTNFSTLPNPEKRRLFDLFKQTHRKQYKSVEEEDKRFGHFDNFLKLLDERNKAEQAKGGSALHGITKFSDLSESQFKSKYLTYVLKNKENPIRKTAQIPNYQGTETSVDWSDVYTTAVKDQGYCGSCWAFSAAEQIESDSIRKGLLTTNQTLSTQQIVSCDRVDLGCAGGNTETAYEYVARAGGLMSDSDYPYRSYYTDTGACRFDGAKALVTVKGFYTLRGEVAMENYVLSTGPLSVCLDATTWSSYTSGIITSCGTEVNHCVQVVGINTKESYWKVRNSWGSDWGDKGYIYLKTDANICNISYDPTYTVVEPV